MGAMLRHGQPQLRAPMRSKPVPRGASRPVVKEPLSVRLPRPGLGLLKRIGWPFLLLGLGMGAYELSGQLLPYADRPIAKVSVEGNLGYIDQQAVQQRIAPFVNARFFSIDLAAMRAELESMPWIAHAEVSRVWPDEVKVRLDEQLPIARWGSEALLNNAGEAFRPRQLENYGYLPQLQGPARAQQRVMQQYQVLSQMLRPLGFSLVGLELRERGSWFARLRDADGNERLQLLLGRDHLVEKIRRFSRIYDKSLKAQIDNIERIDLRYPNGLAVGWREPPEQAQAKGAGAQ